VRDTDRVPDFCTCGAQLPADARFCHKCGKPQRDEPLIAALEPVIQPVVSQPAITPPPRVSFNNSAVVKACLVAAVLTFLFLVVAVAFAPVRVLAPVAAGLFAVYLYTRRTGRQLSVFEGLQVGWMTGVFLFIIIGVLFTASYFVLSSRGGLSAAELEMFRDRGVPKDQIDSIEQLFRNPLIVPALLLIMFMILTILPMVGGAVGAKLFGRKA